MYILDTCVVSELWRDIPDSPIPGWIRARDPDLLFISVVTIGEIQKGISKLPLSRKQQRIAAWFQNEFLKRFAGKILTFDEHVAIRWGTLVGLLETKGRKLPVLDSLIAATALVHGATLVTRNESDFDMTELQILNPWV